VRAATKHDPRSRSHSSPHPSIVIPGRPKPREEWYKGCPPWGHGGDVEADLLRNRIDPATHLHSFTAEQFLRLHWPGVVSRQRIYMAQWSRTDRQQAFRYEGMAASLTGYLIAFDRLGPSEPCNCLGKAGYDWHFWIAPSFKDSRKQAIIAEATPRIRARERGFSWQKFATLAGQTKKVRLIGWVFLDNDHRLDDSDRATLWEIHPVTRVQVQGKHGWVTVAG
jgi:hypothetical protein